MTTITTDNTIASYDLTMWTSMSYYYFIIFTEFAVWFILTMLTYVTHFAVCFELTMPTVTTYFTPTFNFVMRAWFTDFTIVFDFVMFTAITFRAVYPPSLVGTKRGFLDQTA